MLAYGLKNFTPAANEPEQPLTWLSTAWEITITSLMRVGNIQQNGMENFATPLLPGELRSRCERFRHSGSTFPPTFFSDISEAAFSFQNTQFQLNLLPS